MTKRTNIPQNVKQKLWILADNVCALPTCKSPLYETASDTYVGEIAHIEASSIGGPRFNPNLSPEGKNHFSNLLLVCPKCHKEIDTHEPNYTVEKLKHYKDLQINKINLNKQELLSQNKYLIEKLENCINETISFLESTTNLHKVDSPELWFKTFLKIDTDPIFLERIGLPYATKMVPAFSTIIESSSPYSIPVIRYLCNRVYIYFSVVDEVCMYYPSGNMFKEVILNGYRKINKLLNPYSSSDNKRVKIILDAIQKQELAPYRDYWNTTDLRVVLKTLHEDKTICEQREQLLVFVFQQLNIETSSLRRHHIPEPRHAWWSIETLLDEMNREWIDDNFSELDKAIRESLNRDFEENPKIKLCAVASELHTKEMEDYWGTINMIKILRISCEKNIPFEIELLKEIENKVRKNIEIIKSDSNGNRFIVFCIKLILLHEFKNYISNL